MKNLFVPLLLPAVCAATLLWPVAEAWSAKFIAGKPTTFSVERISFLRSQDVKPERAGPVIYDDLIFIASSRNKLVAFDFQGNRRSAIDIGFAPLSTPVIHESKMYSGGSDGFFHCMDLATGDDDWSHQLRSIDLSTPAVAEGNVIFQTANDRVMALDLETGEWRWEYQHLRADDLAVRSLSPPVVKGQVVYIGLSGGSVAAMDAGSGLLIWKSRAFKGEQFKDVDAQLQVDRTSVYAASVSGEFATLSRKTGKLLWKYDAGGMAGCALEGDTIYLATDDAELIAIDKVTGKETWKSLLMDREKIRFGQLPTRPRVAGPYVLTVSREGKITALDKTTGEIVGARHFRTQTSTPLMAIEDTGFFFIDNQGVIRLWRDIGS
jgi:outer membrane protein assembly factor BamB